MNARTLDVSLETDAGHALAALAPSAHALPPARRVRQRGDWTTAEREQLIKDWNEGESSGKLAERYSRTRSSVVGMVKRLRDSGVQMRVANALDTGDARRANADKRKAAHEAGVSARPATFKSNRRKKSGVGAQFPATRRSFPLVQVQLPATAADEIASLNVKRKGLIDLEADDCRWPIGDPQSSDFYFCAMPKIPGLPYCDFHHRKAYQPAQPRRSGIRASGSSRAGPSIEDTVNG